MVKLHQQVGFVSRFPHKAFLAIIQRVARNSLRDKMMAIVKGAANNYSLEHHLEVA
jgi:hypothetical protein